MARPVAEVAPILGIPLEGMTKGVTYSTSHGKEVKLEVRHYSDSGEAVDVPVVSEDNDTHTVLHIGDYQLRDDDENSRDFANRILGIWELMLDDVDVGQQ
eukprot:Skav202665  [mRNA]  locus=scaffold1791:298887:300052:+ [translate_table: standard]